MALNHKAQKMEMKQNRQEEILTANRKQQSQLKTRSCKQRRREARTITADS